MKPRWYRRGQTISSDTFTTVCQKTGWYLVYNHYGNARIIRLPLFWHGLWWRLTGMP